MDKSISLVLGSGGARGLAHIGVIRVLEAHGFRIRSVVGCSMGALIGGFYAAGKLDTYSEWVSELRELDVLRFLDVSLTARTGLMKGDLLVETLRELVGERRIEDLPLPFTAIATDIRARKEVWLCRGDLFDAIRASIAIPGIFTPHEVNGRLLVDGGLINPLPVAPTTDDATDMTIAVDVTAQPVANPLGEARRRPEPPPATGYRKKIEDFVDAVQERLGLEDASKGEPELNLSDVLINAFDTMQGIIGRFRLAAYRPDLLISIPVNVCRGHEFYKANQIIAAGSWWAEKAVAELAQGSK